MVDRTAEQAMTADARGWDVSLAGAMCGACQEEPVRAPGEGMCAGCAAIERELNRRWEMRQRALWDGLPRVAVAVRVNYRPRGGWWLRAARGRLGEVTARWWFSAVWVAVTGGLCVYALDAICGFL